MKLSSTSWSFLFVLFTGLSTACYAATEPANHQGHQTNKAPHHIQAFNWSSGHIDGTEKNQANKRADVFTTVQIEAAPWLQLDFTGTVLGKHDYIEISSVKDGFKQRLNHETLKQWGYHSAFFNGDAIRVKMYVDQLSRDAKLVIPNVKVGERAKIEKSLCGIDNRVASLETRVARIDPIGCTGWSASNGKLLTAGHCLAGSGNTTLSFNPPASLPDGTVQFPPPQRQYAIDQTSFTYTNGGVGDDWGIFRVFNNATTGQQPIDAQGAFNLVRDLGPTTIRITGFGVDGGTTNQTNQTHAGPNAGSSGTVMRYVTDTMGGNSGSPVIDTATGRAVGIHTHGGCGWSSGNNHGTSFFNSALWSAVGSLNQPINGMAELGDNFGAAVAKGDFDGDGRDDLAIGVPDEDIGATSNAGAVNVLYGSPSRLTASANQIWHQDSPSVIGVAEANDQFGYSLASGDFNQDGYDDLAIGAPYEDIGSINSAGAVNILYGSPSGLTSAGDQMWHQNSSGIIGSSETSDQFGYSLTSGDFDNDGYDDLAIGVPGEAIGSLSYAGAANVLYGSASGLTNAGDQMWHQDSSGIAGVAESFDHLGYSLTSGDFDNDGYDDLAIGAPGEDIGTISYAGAVNVIYGTGSGLNSSSNQLWHQNSAGISGVSEASDWFGLDLTAADFDGDGRDDLAVGVPGESIGAIAGAGAVNVIYGSFGGLNSLSNQLWHQDSSGIQGVSEAYDRFGYTLSSGDFNNNGRDDLAIGVYAEDIGAVNNAGAVNVLYGQSTGLTSINNQLWHQDSNGILGVAEASDNFGLALAAGDFDGNGRDDLAVGVPGESIGSTANAGAVNVLYSYSSGLSASLDQLWHQDN